MNQLDSLLWLKDCVDFRVLKGWYSQEKKYQAVKPNGRRYVIKIEEEAT
ncbi:hypothetical protein [Priestia koreensis]|nr:hypothetical protein [Priestia koreensis]MCM3004988.1 hypothetical protein [Priestia koreensis]UNL82984.1 hypothetical protein IE339_12305 [Priestia koreensis]